MFAIYLGLYIFLLAILWGFFLIARHHSYKFKHFSKNIVFITNILFIFLIILTIVGFIAIWGLDSGTKTVKIDDTERIENISY